MGAGVGAIVRWAGAPAWAAAEVPSPTGASSVAYLVAASSLKHILSVEFHFRTEGYR